MEESTYSAYCWHLHCIHVFCRYVEEILMEDNRKKHNGFTKQ